MIKEFREFIMRGNVLDLAVGVVIGAAFGGIVTSLVNDIIMPPIGVGLGKVDFRDLFIILKEGTTPGPYASVVAAKAAGAVTLNWGAFINTIINFLIVGLAIFLLVRTANKLHKKPEPSPAPPTKECVYCLSSVPLKATRCPHCTSDLKAA